MMKRKTNNKKGFIFTLDAVFALIIAAIGTSILLYVDFTGASSYGIGASLASGIMQSMLQTSLLEASNGSVYLNYLSASAYASTYPWQQFGHDGMLSSATGYAQQAPLLLYTYTTGSNVILPAVAVNSGMAAVAAGTKVYIINATTGNLVANTTANPANVFGAPAIYSNMFFYATSNRIVKSANLFNGSTLWSFTTSNQITTPIEIENNYVTFGTSNGFYVLSPLSGKQIAFANLGSQSQVPIYLDGEYVVSTTSQTSQNHIYSYVMNGNSFTNVWNALLTSSLTTQPSSINNTIAVGSGNYLYIFATSGSQIFKSSDLLSRVLGIGGYGSSYYVQTARSQNGFTDTGSSIFGFSTVNDIQNSTPSIGPGTTYTLINGNTFIGYNISTQNPLFNISLPSNYLNTGYSNIAIAYGNLYVPKWQHPVCVWDV